MSVIDALNWRYSVKKFSQQKLTKQQLDNLLEATRLSPSSYGLQPFRVIVIESIALREKLLPLAYNQTQIVDCSHLLVLAARTDVGEHMAQEYVQAAKRHSDIPRTSLDGLATMICGALNKMTPQEARQWAHHQAYVALGNLLTSAALMQIDTCPIGGFDPDGFDRALGLAEQQLTSTVLCPIGIRHRQDEYATRSKVRYPIKQLVLER